MDISQDECREFILSLAEIIRLQDLIKETQQRHGLHLDPKPPTLESPIGGLHYQGCWSLRPQAETWDTPGSCPCMHINFNLDRIKKLKRRIIRQV